MKYTHMTIECDLCVTSFEAAMATMDVPIYLHVHPSNLDRAREVLGDSKMVAREVIAVADDSITNVNEWYLVTAIGSSPP